MINLVWLIVWVGYLGVHEKGSNYNKAHLRSDNGIDLFYCMKVVVKPIEKLRQSYQIMLDSKEEPVGKTLNLALLSNPFIKDQEHFRAIQH